MDATTSNPQAISKKIVSAFEFALRQGVDQTQGNDEATRGYLARTPEREAENRRLTMMLQLRRFRPLR